MRLASLILFAPASRPNIPYDGLGVIAHGDVLNGEVMKLLLKRAAVRIERIVSAGQITPEGKWYDQDADEWVLLVSGHPRRIIRISGTVPARG
jgi:hypothetical protein